MKNLGAVLAAFCGIFLSVAASSETRIFGIGHDMTTAEILDELQVRNWISEEEAVPTFQVLNDWAPVRRSEFELKTDEERIDYYDLVQGAWRDPFTKKIEISNQNIELTINNNEASISFKCGSKFQCTSQQDVLVELYKHLGCDDFLYLGTPCKIEVQIDSFAPSVEYSITDVEGNEYILTDESLTISDLSARVADNIDTVYRALGFYVCESNDIFGNDFVSKEPCDTKQIVRESLFD